MTWIDNILQLQYYNQPKDVPCYCEILVYPYDLVLQGAFKAAGASYTLLAEVMSANGTTVYEDATTYFETWYGVNPNTGQHFFNTRLKSFAPSMCAHACYILHVRVTAGSTVVFDKYTERYCQSSCCDLARDIDIAQDGLTVVGGDTTTITLTFEKHSECGDPLITLTSRFDCYDKFTGDYYGVPPVVLSGTPSFSLYKFTNMRGRIVRRPREINREYSYNCRLQRVESKSEYLLEGFEYFPAWKMIEIEAQLHSSEIYVEGRRYEYAGGTPFKQIHNCREVFKLEATLEDCTVRQVFGCAEPCSNASNFDGAMKMFVIPEGYDGGAFYNEQKVLVAEDYAGLLTYFRGLDGISAVNDINVSSLECLPYKAFSLSGSGYIPSSFYYDSTTATNRVFGVTLNDINDICGLLPLRCKKPAIDTEDIVTEDQPCTAPELGSATVEDMTANEIAIAGYGDWAPDTDYTEAVIYQGIVTLHIEVVNDMMAQDPEAPGDNIFISSALVAVIGAGGRPSIPRTLDSNNSSLPVGAALFITTSGFIYYTGYTTAVSSSDVTIILSNINYNI